MMNLKPNHALPSDPSPNPPMCMHVCLPTPALNFWFLFYFFLLDRSVQCFYASHPNIRRFVYTFFFLVHFFKFYFITWIATGVFRSIPAPPLLIRSSEGLLVCPSAFPDLIHLADTKLLNNFIVLPEKQSLPLVSDAMTWMYLSP